MGAKDDPGIFFRMFAFRINASSSARFLSSLAQDIGRLAFGLSQEFLSRRCLHTVPLRVFVWFTVDQSFCILLPPHAAGSGGS